MAAKNIIKKNRFIDRQERLSYAKVSEGLHYLSPFKYKKPSGYF